MVATSALHKENLKNEAHLELVVKMAMNPAVVACFVVRLKMAELVMGLKMAELVIGLKMAEPVAQWKMMHQQVDYQS